LVPNARSSDDLLAGRHSAAWFPTADRDEIFPGYRRYREGLLVSMIGLNIQITIPRCSVHQAI
jgi:hypothetical protein